MKVLGSSLKRAIAWGRENVEYAPFLAFLVLVAFVQVSFAGLFILLKIALLILLAAGCTIAYVILHDGPAIARAAAAAKLTGDTVVIPEPRSNVSRAAPKAPMELPSTVVESYPFSPPPALPESAPLPVVQDAQRLTLGELKAAGIVTPAVDLYIGWDLNAERPVRVSWDEGTGSIIVCGASHTGKTKTVEALCAQAVEKARRPCLIVCDTDLGNPRSLTTRMQPLAAAFLEPPARTPAGILERLRCAERIMLDRRDAFARGEPVDLFPVKVVLEEWPSLIGGPDTPPAVAKELMDVACHIARQGSKQWVDLILCSQSGTKDSNGAVQDLVTTFVVHRNAFAQVRYLTGTQVDVTEYPDGMCFLRVRARTWERVQIPLAVPSDLPPIVALVRHPAPLVTDPGNGPGTGSVMDGPLATVVPLRNALRNAPGNGSGESVRNPSSETDQEVATALEGVTPEQWQRVVRESLEGKLAGQLAQDVFGAPPRGGSLTHFSRLAQEIVRRDRLEQAARLARLEDPGTAAPPPLPHQAGTGSGTGAPADPHGRTGGSPRPGGTGQPGAGRGTDGETGGQRAGDEGGDAGT